MKQESRNSNASGPAVRAVQVDDQPTCRVRPQKGRHLLHKLLHGVVPRRTPHDPRVSANMSSEIPAIVRAMEMSTVDLQRCDTTQSWLSVGPPRSRCHYQDIRTIQPSQGLVQSGLHSREVLE